MTDAVRELLGGPRLPDEADRVAAAAMPAQVLDAWATVELDRAAGELGEVLTGHGEARRVGCEPDELLGARAELLNFPDGTAIVLLEPATEGPLAASLARFGEGLVARYLVADAGGAGRVRGTGFRVSVPGGGPLGRQRRVVVGPAWGPHLLLVEADRGARPATIER